MTATIRRLVLLLTLAVALLASVAHAQATTWDVTYYVRANVAAGPFVGPGAYLIIAEGAYGYTDRWNYLGPYGQAPLPASMPAISFPAGTDAALAVPVIGAPEPRVLHRILSRHLGSLTLKRWFDRPLQRATAWGVSLTLRALRHDARLVEGVYVSLPSATIWIHDACSGLVAIKWLTLLALLLSVGEPSWRGRLVLTARPR